MVSNSHHIEIHIKMSNVFFRQITNLTMISSHKFFLSCCALTNFLSQLMLALRHQEPLPTPKAAAFCSLQLTITEAMKWSDKEVSVDPQQNTGIPRLVLHSCTYSGKKSKSKSLKYQSIHLFQPDIWFNLSIRQDILLFGLDLKHFYSINFFKVALFDKNLKI